MRVEGIEPSQALSYWSLNPARLTTPAYPHKGNLRFALINPSLKRDFILAREKKTQIGFKDYARYRSRYQGVTKLASADFFADGKRLMLKIFITRLICNGKLKRAIGG